MYTAKSEIMSLLGMVVVGLRQGYRPRPACALVQAWERDFVPARAEAAKLHLQMFEPIPEPRVTRAPSHRASSLSCDRP